jgi:hypothetical protein
MTFINLFVPNFATVHPSSDHFEKKIDCIVIINTIKFITIHHFCILGPSSYMFICFHCLTQLEEWPKGGGLKGVALCLFFISISYLN